MHQVKTRHFQVTKAAVEKLGGLSLLLSVITITLDNGKAFADHVIIADKLGAKVYLAKPSCMGAWTQRAY